MLPFFVSHISKPENNKGISGISINRIFGQAITLFHVFEQEHSKKLRLVIITGNIHQGKTTFAEKIITDLLEQKVRIAGFLSIGINENGMSTGYNLSDIESLRQYELCSTKKDGNRLKPGQYYFNNDTISRGIDILSTENISDKQLIVIDEIGPLELNGHGCSNAIEKITGSFVIPHIWVVRKSIVKNVIRKWNIGDAYIFDIQESNLQEVEKKLHEILLQKGQT